MLSTQHCCHGEDWMEAATKLPPHHDGLGWSCSHRLPGFGMHVHTALTQSRPPWLPPGTSLSTTRTQELLYGCHVCQHKALPPGVAQAGAPPHPSLLLIHGSIQTPQLTVQDLSVPYLQPTTAHASLSEQRCLSLWVRQQLHSSVHGEGMHSKMAPAAVFCGCSQLWTWQACPE